MASKWWTKTRILMLVPLTLLITAVMACGSDPEPVDLSGVSEALGSIQESIGEIKASSVSAAQVQAMVDAAVTEMGATGVTPEQVRDLVDATVKAATANSASAEEVKALVEKAVADAAKAASESALSAEGLTAVIKSLLPTPVPTAAPTPTPGFRTAQAARIITASGFPTQETTINFQTLTGRGHLHAMYESLFGGDRFTGEYTPELAESWSASADAKSWTVNLRKGAQFKSKTTAYGEFTAKDVIHSWERTTTEGFSSDARTWIALVSSKDDFNVVDDHTIVFNLTRPELDFVFYASTRNGTMFMISKDQWDEGGLELMRAEPAGTGPWTMRQWYRGSSMVYDRVENHWRQTPEFREAQITWVPEQATRLAQLISGEIHVTDLSRDVQKQALAKGMSRSIGAMSQSALQGYFLGLWDNGKYTANPVVSAFDDVRVREAMIKAMNRIEINEELFDGMGIISAASYSHPSFSSYDDTWDTRMVDMYGYNPTRSKELLAEAGYGPDNPLKVLLYDIQWNGWPEFQPIAESTAQWWIDVGIDVTIESIEYGRVREQIREENPEWAQKNPFMYFPPWFLSPRPFQVSYSYYSGEGGVLKLFTDTKIDEWYEELLTTTDLDRRDFLEWSIDELVFTQYGDLTLLYYPFEVAYNSAVVASYVFPGVYTDAMTELEYATAADHS